MTASSMSSVLATSLRWPKEATLKDFRHLFLTTLSNAGLSDPYRQYLADQSQSFAAITNYTHLNDVRRMYLKAVEHEWGPSLAVLENRVRKDPSTLSDIIVTS